MAVIHRSSPLTLLAAVRWQVFRNSLRSRRKKFELAAQILKGVFGTAIVLAVGLKLGHEAYIFLAKGKGGALPGLWFVFAVWQLAPLLVEAASPALNFREIARFPVSFRLYYLLNTAYGLLDPAALACLVWLGCIGTGIWFARPEAVGRAAVFLAAFAAVNLLLNRVLFGFFERVLSTRRGRERVAAAILVFVVLSQIAMFALVPRVGREHLRNLGQALSPVQRVLPAGLVSRGVVGDSSREAIVPLLALGAYAAAAAFVLRRQLWRNYQGEVYSETAPAAGAVQVQPGWKLPLLDEATSAMVEKELRYALRDPRTILAFLAPPLLALVATLSSEVRFRLLEGVKFRSELLYAGLAGYVVMSLGTMAYNSFCYDARGFERWLMAPVELRRVFLAKNAALGALLAANFALVSLLVFAGPGLSLSAILKVAAGFAYAALAVLGAGNLVSAWYPMGRSYGELSAKKVSNVAVLVIVLAQMAILGSLWLVFHLGSKWHPGWSPLPGFLVLMVAALGFYLFSLDAASEYVWNHSEEVAAELA